MRYAIPPHVKNLIQALIILFLICLSQPAAAAGAIGLVVAKTSTFETIKSLLTVISEHSYAGRRYLSGEYQGHHVVLVRSPMGKVNNTITTQTLLSEFEIDLVISIAPAGAVGETVAVGHIVLADRVYQHDFGTIKPYGFIWGKAPDGKDWDEAGYQSHPEATDNTLKRLQDTKQSEVFVGPVVSGDQLIASREKRTWLHNKFNAMAVDMSAAAIAQTCYANMTRCLILRVVTDHADESARSDFEASLAPGSKEPDYRMLFKALVDT